MQKKPPAPSVVLPNPVVGAADPKAPVKRGTFASTYELKEKLGKGQVRAGADTSAAVLLLTSAAAAPHGHCARCGAVRSGAVRDALPSQYLTRLASTTCAALPPLQYAIVHRAVHRVTHAECGEERR